MVSRTYLALKFHFSDAIKVDDILSGIQHNNAKYVIKTMMWRFMGGMAGIEFGVTDTLNSKNLNKPVEEVIKEMTDGEGVDFSFDCTGNPGVIMSAMECANSVCY